MKRGQATASGAGGAIILIAGFIILYLLLVDPEAREELLSDDDDDETEIVNVDEVGGNVLLIETPGTVHDVEDDEFEHRINSFNLYSRSEDSVMKSIETAYISTSRSSENTKKIILVLDDAENTKNVFLSFNIEEHKGRLIVLLNDDEIFNGDVSGFQQVKLEALKDENLVELKASEIGWLSFSSNYYELKDIKIAGTETDVSAREAINSFYLSPEETDNMKSAYLIYMVDCKKTIGKLSVYLNEDIIESRAPDCGSPVKTLLDPAIMAAGRNELRFTSDGGAYLIDRVAVKTQLKEALYPIYYFEINSTKMRQIKAGNLTTELSLEFVDDNEKKVAELNINGHKSMVDTRDAEYIKNIDHWVEEGNNYVKIEPKRSLQIVEVRVELIKVDKDED